MSPRYLSMGRNGIFNDNIQTNSKTKIGLYKNFKNVAFLQHRRKKPTTPTRFDNATAS